MTYNQLTKDDLSKVIISKLDNKAGICLIKTDVYIFNSQGDFLQKKNFYEFPLEKGIQE